MRNLNQQQLRPNSAQSNVRLCFQTVIALPVMALGGADAELKKEEWKMHTKTMEGLVGARTNIDMANVPMRVYKEARRKGDTATMKRSMGYVSEFDDRAGEYQKKAEEGMKKDAQEAAEKEKAQRQEMVEKRREEKRQTEEKLAADREENAARSTDVKNAGKAAGTCGDTVQLSEQGKALSENRAQDVQEQYPQKCPATGQNTAEGVYMDRKPAVYTKTGEAISLGRAENISVSV